MHGDPSKADQAAAGQGARGAEAVVLSDLVRWIVQRDGSLEADDIDSTAGMYDAGYIDSMRAADLLVHIEDHYQVIVSERALAADLASLATLAAHISADSHGTGH